MLIPGIVSATFKTMNAGDVVDLVSKASLNAVEWSENHHVKPGDTKTCAKIAEITADKGLVVAGYGSYYRLGQEMDIRPSLDNAQAIGAKNIRIWAGSVSSSDISEEERKKLTDELEMCIEKAALYGIRVNTEWHRKTLTDTNESAISLLEKIRSPYFGTLWQPSPDIGFKERYDGLCSIKGYLSYFHVYYWDETGRRPLEEGIEHWKKYFSVLNVEKKYYSLLEFVQNDSVEQFFKDSQVLLNLCDIFNRQNLGSKREI